jgi:hypothetical protein
LLSIVSRRLNRNAKAELNRRSQACEVLTGTGISRRKNSDLTFFYFGILFPGRRAEAFASARIASPSLASLNQNWPARRGPPECGIMPFTPRSPQRTPH